jgi:hypothetical protein
MMKQYARREEQTLSSRNMTGERPPHPPPKAKPNERKANHVYGLFPMGPKRDQTIPASISNLGTRQSHSIRDQPPVQGAGFCFAKSRKISVLKEPIYNSCDRTVVGNNCDVRGNVNCNGVTKINGDFEGTMISAGDVMIYKDANVRLRNLEFVPESGEDAEFIDRRNLLIWGGRLATRSVDVGDFFACGNAQITVETLRSDRITIKWSDVSISGAVRINQPRQEPKPEGVAYSGTVDIDHPNSRESIYVDALAKYTVTRSRR